MSIDSKEFLKQVVAIPSLSGEESKVANYIVETLKSYATETFIDGAGNVVVKFMGTSSKQIMFLGHIDTVAGDIPVEIKDNKLYGRGSVDAKGSICTALMAAVNFWQKHKDINLIVIGAVEEEAASSKGARFVLANYPKPDVLIIGEPSGWEGITLGYKGRLVIKLITEKGNFHSAAEETTAVEEMVIVWQKLQAWQEQLNEHAKGIFNKVQMSLQSINSTNDGLQQICNAFIGFRLPLSYPPSEIEKSLSEFLGNEGLQVQLEVNTPREQPYRADKDSVLSRAFRNAIRQQGGKPRFKLKTGTSDMNVVAPHWKVPTIAYGPGDSSLDHTPIEHLGLDEYEQAIAVFERALEFLTEAQF